MKYEYKVGKDGLVRHKPCWYTMVMQTCTEGIVGESEQLKEIHLREKSGQIDENDKEWKELCRWFLNDFKKGLNDAQKSYNEWCVGKRECSNEDILEKHLTSTEKI